MKTRILSLFALVLLAGSTLLPAQVATWKIDTGHSSVLFSIRHILTPFYGEFTEFDITLNWDPSDVSKSSVTAKVMPGSVSTNAEERDEHLKGPEMFDAGTHPEWTFQSTMMEKRDNGYVAKGEMTVKGVTKEIEVPFQFLGIKDMGQRGKKAGATAEFVILRSDFGLGKAGGSTSDDVKIIVNMELNGN